MKKKISIFISLFSIIVACNKKTIKISDGFIKDISNTNPHVPSAYVEYNLYLRTDNNSIFETNITFLNDIYINHYKERYNNLYGFLQVALKQNFVIENSVASKYEYMIFNEDPNIDKLSSEEIIKEYFVKDNEVDEYFFYPKNLSVNKIKTVLYKMFLDGYLITFDDYGGKYEIKKY